MNVQSVQYAQQRNQAVGFGSKGHRKAAKLAEQTKLNNQMPKDMVVVNGENKEKASFERHGKEIVVTIQGHDGSTETIVVKGKKALAKAGKYAKNTIAKVAAQ